MCRGVFAVDIVYLSYLTLFSLCSYYKNKIFINTHSLTRFFSDEKHLIAVYFILWAEFAMGRVCNGPRVLWAEFVMGQDVPEPSFYKCQDMLDGKTKALEYLFVILKEHCHCRRMCDMYQCHMSTHDCYADKKKILTR